MSSLQAHPRTRMFLACLLLGIVMPRAARAIDASGIVTDTAAKPIGGVTIEVLQVAADRETWPDRTSQKVVGATTSRVDGTFTLEVPISTDSHEQIVLRAMASGKANSWILSEPDRPAGQTFLSDTQTPMARPWFVMVPEQTVRGVVVNEAGQPISDVEINPGPAWDNVMTGPDGKFQIDHFSNLSGTPFDDERLMTFSHPDYVRWRQYFHWFQYSQRQADGSLRIVLKQGVLVRGQVTDFDTHEPVPGAHVVVANIDGWTDAQGRFAIHIARSTDARIWGKIGTMTNPNYLPTERERTLALPADKDIIDGVDLQFLKGVYISGNLHTAGGGPLPAKVTIILSPTKPTPVIVQRGATFNTLNDKIKPDGTFRLSAIPPGDYMLRVAQGGGQPLVNQPMTIFAGQDVKDMAIELPAQASQPAAPVAVVWIKVLNPDGTPAPLAVLQMGSRRFADANGEFHGATNSSTDRAVMASDFSGRLSGFAMLDSNVQPQAPIEIRLAPAAKLSGQAFDVNGNPKPDQNVQLIAGIVGTRVIWTDADGKFTFAGLVGLKSGNQYKVSMAQGSSYTITELQPGQEVTGFNFRASPSGTFLVAPQRAAANPQ